MAESPHPEVRIPTRTVSGQSVYAGPLVPEGKAKTYGPLWQRVVRDRQAHNADQLSELLGLNLDNPRARALVADFSHRMRVPLRARPVPGADGKTYSVFELCEDREQVREAVKSLRSRRDTEYDSTQAVVQRAESWVKTPPAERTLELPHAVPPEVDALLEPLLRGVTLTNDAGTGGEIGELLRERRAELESQAQQAGRPLPGRARAWSGPQVRAVLNKLQVGDGESVAETERAEGWPIIADDDGGGYRLLRGGGDIKPWVERRVSRIDALDARIASLEEAGALWYPETTAEDALAASYAARPRSERMSDAEERRVRQDREAKERAKQAKSERNAGYRELSQALLDGTDEQARDARIREMRGKATAADEALLRKRKLARQFLKTGRRPRLRREEQFTFLPPARLLSPARSERRAARTPLGAPGRLPWDTRP